MTQWEQSIKKKIRKEIRDRLDECGIYYDNVAQGQYSKPGQPDLIICYDGEFIGVEVKTPNGSQSKIQCRRETQIRQAGGWYIVVQSWDELKDYLGKLDGV